MDPSRTAARALPWALAAALLAGGAATFRAVRALARVGDRRDPIVLLEHPTGGAAELLRALGSGGAPWLRLAAYLSPALLLALVCWRWRASLRWRGALIGSCAGIALLCAWQALADERLALRTLCWAAHSGVYDRTTREQALARGRAHLASPLGRLAEALGARARPSCDAASAELGLDRSPDPR
jgi:hypothetical protein